MTVYLGTYRIRACRATIDSLSMHAHVYFSLVCTYMWFDWVSNWRPLSLREWIHCALSCRPVDWQDKEVLFLVNFWLVMFVFNLWHVWHMAPSPMIRWALLRANYYFSMGFRFGSICTCTVVLYLGLEFDRFIRLCEFVSIHSCDSSVSVLFITVLVLYPESCPCVWILYFAATHVLRASLMTSLTVPPCRTRSSIRLFRLFVPVHIVCVLY